MEAGMTPEERELLAKLAWVVTEITCSCEPKWLESDARYVHDGLLRLCGKMPEKETTKAVLERLKGIIYSLREALPVTGRDDYSIARHYAFTVTLEVIGRELAKL